MSSEDPVSDLPSLHFHPGQKLSRKAGFEPKQNKPQAQRFPDRGFLGPARILFKKETRRLEMSMQ